MTKPEPRLWVLRSGVCSRGCGPPRPGGRLRSRKSLKNCSNGEPGGNTGTSGPGRSPPRTCTEVLEEILTTDGNSLAARSAKLSGATRAAAGALAATISPVAVATISPVAVAAGNAARLRANRT